MLTGLTRIAPHERILGMTCARMRTMMAFGFLVCAMAALALPGCSARIVNPAVQEDRPRVPDATASRLQECVEEFGGDLRGGYYAHEYTVKVDGAGHVVDVETDVRDPNVAGCTRIALRAMTVPEDLFRLAPSSAFARTDGQGTAARGLIGNPALAAAAAAAAAAVLADLVIEAGGVTIIFTIAVVLAKDDAETIRCREVKERCIIHCSGSPGLPAPGGGRFRRCMRECMEAEGCSF